MEGLQIQTLLTIFKPFASPTKFPLSWIPKSPKGTPTTPQKGESVIGRTNQSGNMVFTGGDQLPSF
jgi:hypothetical protein